jgi:ubiquinone biosynthesis protein
LRLVLVVARLCRLVVLSAAWLPLVGVAVLVRSKRAPAILRGYLQASGGLFVKLGQVLALRYDLLPVSYCAELTKLLDALPPVSTASIKKVVETSLGKPVAALFAEFDEAPLSCASVAQVHGATLPDGTRVVVKVVRPSSEIMFRADLAFVRAAAALAELVGLGTRMGLRRLARELSAFTREEFDLVRELRNAEQLEAALEKDEVAHAVPRTYPELTARSVLTMERIEGITASRLIAAVEADDRAALAAWKEQGIEPEAVAARLLRSMLIQMFRHRAFHADPHSSNILLRAGGELVFVDFGIFGWLDERQWAQQLRMRQALAANRVHAAYVALVSDFTFPRELDVAAFETDIKEILQSWSQASTSPHATIQEKSAGALFVRVFEAVRRAGVGIPTGLMRLFRALVISDMVILKLDPGIDLLDHVRAFMSEEMTRLAVVKTAKGATTAPATLARLVAEAPELALEAFEWLTDGPGARRGSPGPAAGGAPPSTFDRLVRVLLDAASMAMGAFTILAVVRTVSSRLPIFEDVAAALSIDLGRPALVIGGGLASFLMLRRMAAAVPR